MKISLNWLNEFVDLSGITPEQILERLSMTTAEVEGFERRGHDITGVVVGQIVTCEMHPTSKKPLFKLTVDNGMEIKQVICGAPNCRAGMRVAIAVPGSRLGDINVGVANLAGEESHGMNCSALELGIGTDHDGIIDLDTNLPNGTPIEVAIPALRDIVFEIDNKSLTNRPDLWGHYGIARELAVIFNRKLRPLPVVDLEKYRDLPAVPVDIENHACYSFGAIRVDNVTRKQSPLDMQIRMFYCNNSSSHGLLVDLSNYVMLELGQPNHTFDASRVGKLSAGFAPAGTTFETLKGQTFDVKPNYLFIKSDGKPVSLAGIMGGANSLITDTTTDVVFEFATFEPLQIRRTSNELGIRSDSSTRFEKSLDTNLNKIAAARMIKLLTGLDKRARIASNFNWVVKTPTTEGEIAVDRNYLERFMGIVPEYRDVKRALTGLGFRPKISSRVITVTVPTWRATKDVSLAADVIEEIARTHGYDNIAPTAPLIEIRPVDALPAAVRIRRIKDILVDKYALNEVHSYIWTDAKVMKGLKIEATSNLRVINSVAEGCEAVRTDIIPTLISYVARNKGRDSIRMFEIGGVFRDTEQTQLGIAIASRDKSDTVLYRELAHMVSDLTQLLGVRVSYKLGGSNLSYFHPLNNASITVGDMTVGEIGLVHPTTTSTVDPKIKIATAYICLDKFGAVSLDSKKIRVSKYPKTQLDFTITTKSIYGELESVFDKLQHENVFGYRLKDIYVRENGDISYTVCMTVGCMDKTLTAEEIQNVWQAIVAHAKKHGVTVDNT
ncbi:MAG: phenylalanine--tRNA ligase subunit beta [Firmicutes bacterium]|nr:phenylalanine--tRNA ligase subunit beta [Bacillota bacterium]